MPGFTPGDADFLALPAAQADIQARIQGGEKPNVAQDKVLRTYQKRWTDSHKEPSIRGTPSQIKGLRGGDARRTPEEYTTGRPASGGGTEQVDQIAQMKEMMELASKNRRVVKKDLDYALFHTLIGKGVDPNVASQQAMRTRQIPQEMADLEAKVGPVAARNIMATRERLEGMSKSQRLTDIERRKGDMMNAKFGITTAAPEPLGLNENSWQDTQNEIEARRNKLAKEAYGEGGQPYPPSDAFKQDEVRRTNETLRARGDVGPRPTQQFDGMMRAAEGTPGVGPNQDYVNKLFAEEEAAVNSLRVDGSPRPEGATSPYVRQAMANQHSYKSGQEETVKTGIKGNHAYDELVARNLTAKSDDNPGITAAEVIKEDVITKMAESPGIDNNRQQLASLFKADPSTANYDFVNNLQLPGMEQVDGEPGYRVAQLMNAPYFHSLVQSFNIIEAGAVAQWFGGRSAISAEQYNRAAGALKRAVEAAVQAGYMPTTIRKAWRASGDIKESLQDDWSIEEINEFEGKLELYIEEATRAAYNLPKPDKSGKATNLRAAMRFIPQRAEDSIDSGIRVTSQS